MIPPRPATPHRRGRVGTGKGFRTRRPPLRRGRVRLVEGHEVFSTGRAGPSIPRMSLLNPMNRVDEGPHPSAHPPPTLAPLTGRDRWRSERSDFPCAEVASGSSRGTRCLHRARMSIDPVHESSQPHERGGWRSAFGDAPSPDPMPVAQDRPAALPTEADPATVSPSSRFRLAKSATEHLWRRLNQWFQGGATRTRVRLPSFTSANFTRSSPFIFTLTS